MGDFRECALVVWSTYTCSVLTSTKVAAPVHDVNWNPTISNEFVTAGVEGSLTFWLLDERGKEAVLRRHPGDVPEEVLRTKKFREVSDFTCAAHSNDHTLYAATSDGKVSAWDVTDNSCFMHWQADKCEIEHILCRDSRLLTTSITGVLRLWSIQNLNEIKSSTAPKIVRGGLTQEDEMILDGCVTSVNFDEALQLGIVGTDAGTLWYINWGDRTSIRLVSGHRSKVNGVCMSEEGSYVATCSDDGSLRLWSVDSREQSCQFQVQDQACTCVVFAPKPRDHHQPIKSQTVRFGHSPVRLHHKTPMPLAYLAAGYSDGTLRVYEPNKVEMVTKMHPHAVAVTAISYSSDGCILLSGASDGVLAVSSATSGLTMRVISDHRDAPITSIHAARHYDDAGRLIVPQLWLAASGDSRVSVWSADWSKDKCDLFDWLTFPAPAFAPDGTMISSMDKTLHADLPPSLAKFSLEDDDTILYTGYGLHKSIQFYSISQKQVMRSCSISDWAVSMDLSPKSGVIALGSNDRLVKLMDYYEGTFQDFIGHYDAVDTVKFSPDGSLLFTLAHNEVLVWKVQV